MKESAYQNKIIKKLKQMFPGCVIHKNDPSYMQGIPDLVIYYGQRWAMLEVKASEDSGERPNQRYYVKKFNEMSFAAFIHPDNEAEVLNELQQALDPIG
jgi:hypothetical protein